MLGQGFKIVTSRQKLYKLVYYSINRRLNRAIEINADWDKDKRLKPFKIRSPRIIIEVLSPSTEKYDHKEKFARYRCCPSLEVYMLVSQDEPLVEVYRQSTGWKQERFSAGQTIKLDQIGLDLLVDEIYEGVF